MRLPINPEMKSPKNSTHRKPYRKVNPPSARRAAELIEQAKLASVRAGHFLGSGYADYTRDVYDRYYE